MTRRIVSIALLATAAWSAEGFKVLSKIKIGGEARWDYVALDSVNHRLYVSHNSSVEVIDPDAGKVVGSIPQLHGVHGIAIANDLNRGFITNGNKTSNSVTIFDLKTLAKVGEPAVGNNPDAICYEPKTKRVFSINHGDTTATAIDARTGEVLKTIPTGPTGEFCRADGEGNLFVNLEDSAELVQIDAAKMSVMRKLSLAPCEAPTGLAIDPKNKKLFAACGGNKMMAVIDIPSWKVIATPPIGARSDGAAFDAGLGLAFSSNGEGTLTIIKLVNGKYEAVDTVTTERGARTLTVDDQKHRVYLLAAEYGEQAAGQKGPATLPDSFHVLVVGK